MAKQIDFAAWKKGLRRRLAAFAKKEAENAERRYNAFVRREMGNAEAVVVAQMKGLKVLSVIEHCDGSLTTYTRDGGRIQQGAHADVDGVHDHIENYFFSEPKQ
jgi:hypothetical protein